jgi:hypothetical protein
MPARLGRGPAQRAGSGPVRAWVDDFARPRWAAEARAANELIDRLSAETVAPEDDPAARSEESCSFSLGEGEDRLAVRAWQPGGDFRREAHREGAGWHYSYRVTVRACGTSYTTTYGGSVADHDAGRHDARGGCNCVLRELSDALNYERRRRMGARDGHGPDRGVERPCARLTAPSPQPSACATRWKPIGS